MTDIILQIAAPSPALQFTASGVVLQIANTTSVVALSAVGIQGPSGSGGSGGVTDGDKGDITVSGSGAVWTIDAGAVTLAKQASIATGSIMGRVTAAIGVQEVLTPGQVRTLLNVADGATANATDASLRDRTTHTGTQAVATITGLAAIATSGSAADLSAGILPAARFDDTAHGARAGGALHANAIAAGAAGFMTGADKTKLDGVATGANNYVHPNHSGDVTSVADGATTIAAGAVTLAKQASVATGTVFYRKTAATGAPEVQTLATLKTDLGLTGTNSGDQTSIAGITGTKAQFNTAVTDGDILYVGDAPTAHTHVAANITDFDTAVAANSAVTANTAKVTNATHTGDVTGATALTIAAGVVTKAKSENVATATIRGRVTAATGIPEDLTGTQATTLLDPFTAALKGLAPASGGGTANFLRADGTWVTPGGSGDMVLASAQTNSALKTFLDGTFGLRNIANTFTALFSNANTSARTYTLKDASGTVAFTSDITGVNSGTNTGDQTITLTGDVTGSGTGSFAATIPAGAVTLSKMANLAASTILGNNTGVGATPIALTPAQVKTLLAYTPADIGAATSAQANATHTGDATGATALTLATVNANTGSWGLAASVAQFTVNAKGLITAAANVAISIASTAISDSTAAGRAFLTAATTAAQTALLDLFTLTAKGLVPPPTTSTGKFLRDDGTWAVSGGGSAVAVQDEGSAITAALATLNFVGSGVTVTGGATAVVTIPAAPASVVAARIRRATNQSIAVGTTFVDVSWDTSGYQQGGSFWTSGATVTIPETGYFSVVLECSFDSVGLIGTVLFESQILVNGSLVIDSDNQTAIANASITLRAIAQRNFTAGDTIKVQVRHNQASAVNILTQGDHSPDIIVTKVGGAQGASSPPGGTTGQVQFNNAGAFAGAAQFNIASGYPNLINTANPAAPATDQITLFRLGKAKVPYLGVMGPENQPIALQRDLVRSGAGMWLPPGSGVATPGIFGYPVVTTTGFTPTTRNTATTNYFTRRMRLGYIGAATAGTVGHFRAAGQMFTIGSGAGVGGFIHTIRFGISDAAAVSGARMYLGVATVGVPTNVEPSTLTNGIGIGHGAADTNFKIFYGGSAAQTPIDLGVNFPCTTLSVDCYELTLFAPPNSQVIHYEVRRLNTTDVATGTITGTVGTQVPSATSLMGPWGFRTNNATALAFGLDVFRASIEVCDE